MSWFYGISCYIKLLGRRYYPENGSSRSPRNVISYLQNKNATHPRMYTPSQGPPPEPQISSAVGSRWRKRTRTRWKQCVLRRNVLLFAHFLARSIAFTTRAVYVGFQVNNLSSWQFLDKFLGFSLSFLIPLILHVLSSTIWRTDNRLV